VNTNYVVETWNSENGLPQNTIMRIFQARDGFLWIATFNGLLRYDGQEFKLYNTSGTPGMANNSVKHIVQDNKGVLWFSTINGKLFKYENETFETLLIDNNEKKIVKVIELNEEGSIMVGTEDNEVFYFKNKTFINHFKLPSSQTLNKIIFSAKDSALLIGTSDGLYKYKNRSFSLIPGVEGKVLLTRRSKDQEVWIYTDKGIYSKKNGVFQKYPVPPSVFKESSLTDFFPVDENEIWITTKRGLTHLKGSSTTHYSTSTGLSSNNLSIVYKDLEGNIWVGTSDVGICKMQAKTFYSHSSSEGLLSDVVGAILKTSDKRILVTNFCQGITQFKDNKFSGFDKTTGCVWSLMEDKDNYLWIGTYGNFLYRYKNGVYEHFPLHTNPAFNIVFSIYQSTDGNIWAGTDAGLLLYKNGKFNPYGNKEIGTIKQITQDKQGRIWFCSKNGLGMIENGNTRIYTIEDGLSHNDIRYIYEDEEGTMWIATYGGGLSRFTDNKFFAFNASKNFMDEFTSCIVEDNYATFWISTDHGIYSVKRNDLNRYADGETVFLNTHHFGKENGLKNSECTGGFHPAGMKDEKGRIWFPTLAGVAIVDPAALLKNSYIPELKIENIIVDETKYFKSDSLEIPRNIKKIEFHFTAPFFTESKNILFQYKLDGKDQEWSDPTTSRVASYLGLPPGSYKFHVRIYGSVNVNMNKEVTVSFGIPFPFWKSLPFYTAIGVFLTVALLLFNYYRIRSIRKKEEEKTEINRNYAALELKALQGQMNPHFIFNCLNSIKLFIATDEKEEASKYLGKFSKLIRLSLEHSTSSFMPLTDAINLITSYVELEQLRVDHNFSFNMFIDPELDTDQIDIPTMLLQPFVENAIQHGLWPKEKGGNLDLRFKLVGSMLLIEVEDNGIGRNRSYEMKKHSSEKRVSMGISNTEERVKIINYLKNTNIEVKYTDKTDQENVSEGTLVTISIPLTDNK
jgi:ligand-binding sensor domain-containing protein